MHLNYFLAVQSNLSCTSEVSFFLDDICILLDDIRKLESLSFKFSEVLHMKMSGCALFSMLRVDQQVEMGSDLPM